MTQDSGIYINNLDYPARLREQAFDNIRYGLSLIVRFQNDPYLMPGQRETTAQHVARVKETEMLRARKTLKDPGLADFASYKLQTMLELHDVDEVSKELGAFYIETDEVLQKRLAARKGFTERTAAFWLKTAYITAAAGEQDLFKSLVDESHTLIPAAFEERLLYADELLETFDKLDAFFGVTEKELAVMAKYQRPTINANVSADMEDYRDIEQMRTLLGAVAKMSEKRDGSFFHSHQELKKITSTDHGRPIVAHSRSGYFFKQTGRYEPIIPSLITMTLAEPDYMPYVISAIDSAYETSMVSASFKNYFLTDMPDTEPSERDDITIHTLHHEGIEAAYASQQKKLIGADTPNIILSRQDVLNEYQLARDMLVNNQIILPYRMIDNKKTPTNLLQRDGYDVLKLV